MEEGGDKRIMEKWNGFLIKLCLKSTLPLDLSKMPVGGLYYALQLKLLAMENILMATVGIRADNHLV